MLCLNSDDKSSRDENPPPDTRQGEFERVNIPLDQGERSVNLWISSADLSFLREFQTHELYHHLNRSLGEFFIVKEKPGAVIAKEEADEQGLVSRERAVPEGGAFPGRTNYRQQPRDLPWPERFAESLPIPDDPFLRANALSRQTASWDSITNGWVDQVVN